MKINETMKTYLDYASSLPGADVYYRESWECYYFSLLGKCFGRLNEESLTLKGDPTQNQLLRSQYSDVTPGYYSNKLHWNTIYIQTKQLSSTSIQELILDSYRLVYENLTRKDKAIISEINPHIE